MCRQARPVGLSDRRLPSALGNNVVEASRALSCAHGAGPIPLLGQASGPNLRSTVERHGAREALMVRSGGYRVPYRQRWDAVSRSAGRSPLLGAERRASGRRAAPSLFTIFTGTPGQSSPRTGETPRRWSV
jgi:hypothetical protein